MRISSILKPEFSFHKEQKQEDRENYLNPSMPFDSVLQKRIDELREEKERNDYEKADEIWIFGSL